MPVEPITASAASTEVADKSVDDNGDGTTTLNAPTDGGDSVAEQAVEKAGLDLETLSNQYREEGELSEDAMKALNAAGIGTQYVESYLKGIKAQEELYELQVHNLVGGPKEYEKYAKFAATELSEAELTEVNNALSSEDLSKVKYHLDNIKLRWEQKNGKAGTQLKGNTSKPSEDLYFDTRDLHADQRGELYKTSSRERARVEAKALRSMRAGKI